MPNAHVTHGLSSQVTEFGNKIMVPSIRMLNVSCLTCMPGIAHAAEGAV